VRTLPDIGASLDRLITSLTIPTTNDGPKAKGDDMSLPLTIGRYWWSKDPLLPSPCQALLVRTLPDIAASPDSTLKGAAFAAHAVARGIGGGSTSSGPIKPVARLRFGDKADAPVVPLMVQEHHLKYLASVCA
jgi:hypothetical protein